MAVLFLLCASAAWSQAECSRPAYSAFRFDEDWGFLANPGCRTEPLDVLKFIGLDRPKWFLSLGGEARLRYELYENPGFGAEIKDDNGYLLQRYLLHADWHFGERVRLFSQFQSGIETGRNGGPRPTDEDVADVHQLFVDVGLARNLTLRIGRQELEFGSGKLIGASEGLNLRRAFDGVRFTWRYGKYVWNASLTRPVFVRAHQWDTPDHDQTLWGTGFTRQDKRGGLSGYYLGLARKRVVVAQGIGSEVRHTLGVRLWKTASTLDSQTDIIFQTGEFKSSRLAAGAIAEDFGVTWGKIAWKPRLGIRSDFASGDSGPADLSLQTFSPLFPNPTYSSRSTLLSPANLTSVAPTFSCVLPRSFRLGLEGWFVWRSSTNDAIYNFAGFPIRPALKSNARFVGRQFGVQIDKPVTKHADLNLSYFRFFPGSYLEESPPAEQTGYFSTWLRYRF